MEEKYLLGFCLIPNVGGSKLKKIKSYFRDFQSAWQSSSKEDFLKAGFDEKWATLLANAKANIDLEGNYQLLKDEQIELVTQEEAAFPNQLKEIPHSPYALFCRGDISLLQKKQIAIVGTRGPSDYGKQAAEKIAIELCQAGLTITSGLAQGIDCIAHQAALSVGAPTIAVLGSGINEAMLKESINYYLARELQAKSGLIVSEYPPNFHAAKYTFPARNRIISGLSLGVLVVEAAQKSGSLITANYALEHSRDVFAVPGQIFSCQASGTNTLIRQGALLTRSAADILEALNFKVTSPVSEKEITFENVAEERIYKLLSFEPMHVNEILKKSKTTAEELNVLLSMMELKGFIKSVSAGKFIRM